MGAFRYEAELSSTGKAVQGMIEALDEAEALDLLTQQNLTHVRLIVSPVGSVAVSQAPVQAVVTATAAETSAEKKPVGNKLRLEDKISFYRNTSKMLTAGISIADSMERQSLRFKDRAFQNVLKQLRRDILDGTTLAAALEKHPTYFDSFAVRMVEIGEQSGTLDHVMQRISHLYSQQLMLRKKLLSAAIMPMVTIGAFVILAAVIFGLVMPLLLNAGAGMGLHSPIFDTMRTIHQFWYVIVGLLAVGASLMWHFFFRTEFGQAVVAEILVILPVFRHVVIQGQITQFLYALHMTYQAGIPVSEGISLAVDSLSNHAVVESFYTLQELLTQGKSLAEAFSQTETILPGEIVDTLVTGEETGMLDSSLSTAIEETDEEVQILLDRLPDQLKPIAMLILLLVLASLMALLYGTIFGFLTTVLNKVTFPH